MLMLGNPFLVITFFIGVVYTVVPVSLWKKYQHRAIRSAVIITCTLGYGIIALGIGLDLYCFWTETNTFPGSMTTTVLSPFFALGAGIVFLPLSAAGSLYSLRQRLTESKNSSSTPPIE